MQSQTQERDPARTDGGPSPFRDAFARARLDSLGPGVLAEPAKVGRRRKGRKKAGKRLQALPARARTFEVRIEKRSGKRSKDAGAWNRLGRSGWELIAVQGKYAFFKREV